MKKLSLENRINLLKGRTTENGNIIKKLERRLRKLNNESENKNEAQ